jgi:bifunctional DNA-binding transcriptional regulator/antitoxin component of YhaV-PrlF toxin-antitoxin module
VNRDEDNMTTITMSRTGGLTLPQETRRRLGLDDETELEVEVDEALDAIILRPVAGAQREDAWAYTPEHRELLARAHDDSREGRVRTMTEDELARLGE